MSRVNPWPLEPTLIGTLMGSATMNHFDPKNRSVWNWETIKFCDVSGVSEKYAQPPRQENLQCHHSATCFNEKSEAKNLSSFMNRTEQRTMNP